MVNESFVCHCKDGYSGRNCGEVQDSCKKKCYNRGECVQTTEDEALCVCAKGLFNANKFTVRILNE